MKTFASVMWDTAMRLKLDVNCDKWKMPIDKIMDAMKADLKAVGVDMTPGLFAFDERLGKTCGYDFVFAHTLDDKIQAGCIDGDGLVLRRSNIQTRIPTPADN